MKHVKSPRYILGIETSCDETAAAVIKEEYGHLDVLSNIISSQIPLHAKWGGVVPNLAAREHLKNILPIIESALKKAKIKSGDLDLMSVTNGPGLIPALLIGTSTAKTLSCVWKKPLLGIHHIEGHIYANAIGDNFKFQISNFKFPVLCLVVSGGHTQLVLMKKHLDYEIIGETLDDAAGEAFDKVARILGLGYPGGPAIAEMAMKLKIKSSKFKVDLPRPMINSNNLNFSFSGLKTAVLYTVKKHSDILENVGMSSWLCAEFQQAVIDVLISKTLKAAEIYKPKTIMLAGGVSANLELRKQLGKAIKKNNPSIGYKLPTINYSIDNAAMIAAAGYFRWENMSESQRGKTLANWKKLETDANLKL